MKDSRLEAIFDAVLQKAGAGERAAYLEGACGANAELRLKVETLLKAHDAAGGFLQTMDQGVSPQEGPGTVIGRYKILQRIGEGGFGLVYMAEQLEPVRRKVALKVIKLGMDTRQVVARFESERQALALMDHPHIARVFDGGATDSGRPYFVMELVRGISITEYADSNNLSMRERLKLFVTVCQAVQHAHQKGIIHRDIKPSNVLVTLHDGVPVPKVIDFGIAKATWQRLTDKTIFTEFRQIIGTPQYMSPEQAEMSGLDVDTRCDIYSLGVLLYELMTGSTPCEPERLKTANYAELQRIIREEEPPPPSQRVSTRQNQLETIAKNRRAEPRGLSRMFRGDLDWIVMKSLEKDRSRRYAGAGELAADVERFLRHEPVEAGPPSVLYKVRKFARRNRTSVTATLVVIGALLTGLTLATFGFLRASREADRSQAIARFLEEIVVAVNPSDAESGQVDVEGVVRKARELFGNDHETVAAALDSLATQLQHAGNLQAADRLFRESIRIWRSLSAKYGEKNARLAMTLEHQGMLLRLKGEDAEAEQALRETLDIATHLPEAAQMTFCSARTELATILQQHGRLDEAVALVREALAIRRRQPQAQQYQIAETLDQLVQILILAEKTDEADQAFAEAMTVWRNLFPAESAKWAYVNFAYGHWLRLHGRSQKAEPYLREAVRIYRTMPQPPREYFLASLDGLFQLLRRREESFDESIVVFHECMHNIVLLFGAEHPQLGAHYLGFAQLLGERNRSAETIPLLLDGLRISRKEKSSDWDPGPALELLERHVRRLVLTAGLADAKYQVALDGAQGLVAEKSDNAGYHTLLGLALFRARKVDEALQSLKSEAADETAEHAIQRLAALSLVQRQRRDAESAQSALSELRRKISEATDPPSKETQALVAEAERHSGINTTDK